MELEDLRVEVYRCFAATGRPGEIEGLAKRAWDVDSQSPPDGAEVAHFLVPVSRMWDDVVHTCTHQMLYCSTDCVDAWLESTGHERGCVLDLATLWRLAQGWYAGRLEHGYPRREPSAAAAYLRGVGLSGAFWGLP